MARKRAAKNSNPKSMSNDASPTQRGESSSGLTLRHTLRGHDDAIGKLAWSPDGHTLASASIDGTVRLWNAATGRAKQTLYTHVDSDSVTWAPDGQTLASASHKARKIHILNPKKPRIPQALNDVELLGAIIYDVSWSPDGKNIAAGTSNQHLPILRVSSGTLKSLLKGHNSDIGCVAWSPDGSMLASASADNSVCIWDPKKGTLLWKLVGHISPAECVTWSPNGKILASGAQDNTIHIWDITIFRRIAIIEGHIGTIHSLSFSHDGRFLASHSRHDDRVWSCDTWKQVAAIAQTDSDLAASGIAFHPKKPILATLNQKELAINIWDYDFSPSRLPKHETYRAIRYTSAKIVLVGESNVGKSCLALRLAENRYPKDEEHGTTHGMRLWKLEPPQLDPTSTTPADERRDVVLWDMGGQDEYRLIHQLFLHDTTLALVFLDPTRGRTAIEEVEAWNKRLEKQIGARQATKLLVGSKMDKPSGVVVRPALDELVEGCNFAGYHETSSRTGRGIAKLKKAIAQHLDWDSLAKTSRPELFQHIRDEIDRRRANGEVILPQETLEHSIKQSHPHLFDADAISAVAEQLAVQGVIASTQLASGQRTLVLKVEEIERYAGSLILAARNNPNGVPALEERTLALPTLSLPGILTNERLPHFQEIVVLECVAELLLQHGICFRHEGLLIFPTLFPETHEQHDEREKIPHSVSLYYDFTGAIDNIYASLVARLAVSREFGEHRLWANRVEFDEPSKGVCGIRQIRRKGGLAHIDLFFEETTKTQRRNLFIRFVEDHLRRNGVEVSEHQAIKCRECGYIIDEDIVQENIARGEKDVICPRCRTHTLLSEGVATLRKRAQTSDDKIFALRTAIDKRTKKDAQATKSAVARGTRQRATHSEQPLRILHLSDLHFTEETVPRVVMQSLVDDIKKNDDLRFESLEFLVISGDLTDKGREQGFERAREFISLLIEEGGFGLSAQRCIFVPGNHDVQDLQSSYEWRMSADGLKPGTWVRQGEVILARKEDQYPARFKAFSDAFFHKLIQKPYPSDPSKQGMAYLFPDTRIQFLALNSCWQIDQFHRKRAGVHPEALTHALSEADKQIKSAVTAGSLPEGAKVLRLAVWHHAASGPEMIRDTTFVEHLQNHGVKACLHGDVHETNRDAIKHWHPKKMHILGAGTFGSPAAGRPESVPRLYNLLEIRRDLGSIRVHTRSQPKPNGPWRGWNEWPRPDGQAGALPYFDVVLS